MNAADASATKTASGLEQTTIDQTVPSRIAEGNEEEDQSVKQPNSKATMGKTSDGDDGVVTDPAQNGGGDGNVLGDSSETVDHNTNGQNRTMPAGDGDTNTDNAIHTNAKPVSGKGDQADLKDDDVQFNDSVSNINANTEGRKEIKPSTHLNLQDQNVSAEDTGLQLGSHSGRTKRLKKGIFVSYSPEAGFLERRFVVEMVRQLKENNMAEDIWFDKDEGNITSPCWFSLRMETVEKCRAAVLILSESYFSCPVSMYESKILMERHNSKPSSVKVFPVLFSRVENAEIQKQYLQVMNTTADLTSEDHINKSAAEKTSVVIGMVMEELEKFATVNAPPRPVTPPDTEFTGEFKRKKICRWNAADLQEWLFNLGIKEFYRQSLAEAMVDGFLLMSLTESDMVSQLGIDSRVVRKKIMQQILATLDKEHKHTDSWHLRARAQRPKPDVVYLIYDPADVRLAQNLRTDLKKKNVQVIHHDSMKLGRSKEEFLQINGPLLATATHVVILMTDAMTTSPFIFHEVMFGDWLGKKLVTAMFKNIWATMRSSLKAVLGDCPAVDFETKMYAESLDVLEHHIKPLRRVPGVVLEQSYLNKMAEGLKPLEHLASSSNGLMPMHQSEEDPKVFISYQWDMQSKVDEIRSLLERSGFPCWVDVGMSQQRGHSSRSARSSATFTGQMDSTTDTLQGQIQRSMRLSSVVLCCITPKYLQSDNCVKDLSLAETLGKHIVPLLLRFTALENVPSLIRRILLQQSYVDLSNERLYKQNIGVVLDKVKKAVSFNPR